MRVTVRLVGRVPNEPDVVHLAVSGTGDDKKPSHQQAVLGDLRLRLQVLGLRYRLQGDGVITLVADNDQLTTDVVDTIRAAAQAAIDRI